MNLKISFILSAVLFMAAIAMGQESTFSFNEITHDFGNLQKDAPAETKFVFTNHSQAPIKLTNVKASCGCTTPNWTKEAVAPGATGTIAVKYNTARIGPFRKSVTVSFEGMERPTVLYIKGEVDSPEESEPQVNYQHVLGGLAFEDISQNVGMLESDKEKDMEFRFKNISPYKIIVRKIDHEEMFAVTLDNTELVPGQSALIKVKAIGEKFTTQGYFNSQIILRTTEEENPEKVINISGNLKKVFSAEELAQMPDVKFDQTTYDAGNVVSGEKVVHAFTFTNHGQGDLIIESVKASCGCTATAPKDKIIPAGQTSEIVATFNSKGRQGLQNKSITVKTNDPDQASIVLRLKVNVEKDPFHIGGEGPAARPGGSSFRQ